MGKRADRLSLVALLLHSTLIQAVTFLVRPATSYQALSLDIPAASLGAIGAAFALVPFVLALPVGAAADRIGARRVLVAGSLVTAAAVGALVLFGGTLAGILVGTAALGAGHLGCIVGQQATVANMADGKRLDAMFGYYTFAASLGQAIGPLIIPLVAGSAVTPEVEGLYLIGLGMSGVMIVVAFGIRQAPRVLTSPAVPIPTSLGILRLPGVWQAITTSALIVAAVDLTTIYIPAIGTERDIPAFGVGLLLATRAMASMASRLFLGGATRRFGRARVMAASIALAAVSLVAFALPIPWPALFPVAVLLGFGLGVGQPLTMSWLTEQVPPSRRGTALAIRLAGNRFSQLLIPAAVGTLALAAGAGAVLGAMGVALFAALALVRGVRLDGDEDR